MIGNVSGGQGSEDLAVMILRVAADPKKTEARLNELRLVAASVETQKAELVALRTKVEEMVKAAEERSQALALRERSIESTEKRQQDRAAELQKQGIANRDRTVALNAQEARINTDAAALMTRTDQLVKREQEVIAARADAMTLKSNYEEKLSKLRDVLK